MTAGGGEQQTVPPRHSACPGSASPRGPPLRPSRRRSAPKGCSKPARPLRGRPAALSPTEGPEAAALGPPRRAQAGGTPHPRRGPARTQGSAHEELADAHQATRPRRAPTPRRPRSARSPREEGEGARPTPPQKGPERGVGPPELCRKKAAAPLYPTYLGKSVTPPQAPGCLRSGGKATTRHHHLRSKMADISAPASPPLPPPRLPIIPPRHRPAPFLLGGVRGSVSHWQSPRRQSPGGNASMGLSGNGGGPSISC